MDQIGLVILILFTSLYVFFINRKIRGIFIGEEKIENTISEHYHEKGFIIRNITELSFMEKIKYGGTVFSLMQMHNFGFGMMTGEIDYVRKVDLLDHKNNEYTKYVELIVKKSEVISFKEFASFEL